jgi:hypothetical protein
VKSWEHIPTVLLTLSDRGLFFVHRISGIGFKLIYRISVDEKDRESIENKPLLFSGVEIRW